MKRVLARNADWTDYEGNPAGGRSCGAGFTIAWQDGPLGRHKAGCESEGCLAPGGPSAIGCTVRARNGAFIEDVIGACISRMEHYQASKFACSENATALAALRDALSALHARTRARDARGVEGTHTA